MVSDLPQKLGDGFRPAWHIHHLLRSWYSPQFIPLGEYYPRDSEFVKMVLLSRFQLSYANDVLLHQYQYYFFFAFNQSHAT